MIYDPLYALLSFILASLTSVPETSPVVYGSSGLSYVGLRNESSGEDYFLGIPFAKPPVGTLRFKPPVPWSAGDVKVVNATRDGDSCEQAIDGSVTNKVSEDCLTLNICKFSLLDDHYETQIYDREAHRYYQKSPGNGLDMLVNMFLK